MDLLDRMLEHDYWATSTLLNLSRELPDAQLDRDFDIGHRTLRATFDHQIFNIAAWTAIMQEEPYKIDRSDLSMAALIERHEQSYAAFAAFARQKRDEQRLDDRYDDLEHAGDRPSYGSTVIHVVLHNAEHRSEELHILTRLGVTDLPEIDHALWELTVRTV